MWQSLRGKLRSRGWTTSARALFSLLLGTGAIVGTASAHETSITSRVSAVRSALSERISHPALDVCNGQPGGQSRDGETAQWGNWGNWANWNNWGNWANWRNY